MKNVCEGGATSVKKDRLGHNSEVSRSLEMAKKKLHDSLLIRDPSTHYQLTQVRFIAETFSSGACLVLEDLPAINS